MNEFRGVFPGKKACAAEWITLVAMMNYGGPDHEGYGSC